MRKTSESRAISSHKTRSSCHIYKSHVQSRRMAALKTSLATSTLQSRLKGLQPVSTDWTSTKSSLLLWVAQPKSISNQLKTAQKQANKSLMKRKGSSRWHRHSSSLWTKRVALCYSFHLARSPSHSQGPSTILLSIWSKNQVCRPTSVEWAQNRHHQARSVKSSNSS